MVWDALPGQYLVVVDGVGGVNGSFDISTSCQVAMDCSSPDGFIDMDVGRVQFLAGDTSTGTNTIDVYACDDSLVFDGPENLYEINLTQAPAWLTWRIRDSRLSRSGRRTAPRRLTGRLERPAPASLTTGRRRAV